MLVKERDDSFQHRPYCPRCVPFFRVVLGDSETDFGLSLEPSILGEEVNIGRFEGVFERQYYLSMVDPLMKISVLWTKNSEMPDEQIVLQWLCEQAFRPFLRHRLHLLQYSVLPYRFTHPIVKIIKLVAKCINNQLSAQLTLSLSYIIYWGLASSLLSLRTQTIRCFYLSSDRKWALYEWSLLWEVLFFRTFFRVKCLLVKLSLEFTWESSSISYLATLVILPPSGLNTLVDSSSTRLLSVDFRVAIYLYFSLIFSSYKSFILDIAYYLLRVSSVSPPCKLRQILADGSEIWMVSLVFVLVRTGQGLQQIGSHNLDYPDESFLVRVSLLSSLTLADRYWVCLSSSSFSLSINTTLSWFSLISPNSAFNLLSNQLYLIQRIYSTVLTVSFLSFNSRLQMFAKIASQTYIFSSAILISSSNCFLTCSTSIATLSDQLVSENRWLCLDSRYFLCSSRILLSQVRSLSIYSSFSSQLNRLVATVFSILLLCRGFE